MLQQKIGWQPRHMLEGEGDEAIGHAHSSKNLFFNAFCRKMCHSEIITNYFLGSNKISNFQRPGAKS